MSHRDEINSTFGESALKSPIFYRNPGGLRFELSTGGTFIHQFLTAYRKANEICSYIYPNQSDLILCAEYFGEKKENDILKVARSLRELQLWPKTKKQHWFEPEANDTFGHFYV